VLSFTAQLAFMAAANAEGLPMKPPAFLPPVPACLLVALVLLLTVAAGCGRKGPVRPALLPLPAAAENLSLQQRGDSLLLAWDIPARNQDGSAPTDLQGFRIFRMRIEPQTDCPECRDASSLLYDLDLEYLRQARRVGERLYMQDGPLQAGFAYRYRIIPVTRAGREGAAATIQQNYLPAPPAPAELVASGLDRMVRLRWQGVADDRADGEPSGFRVYRRLDGALFPPVPVNRQPLVEPFFEDFGLQNGQLYHYSVTAVIRVGEQTVESALSESASAIPEEGR
jgi:predicted small lipoprotein YifL